MGSSCAAGFDRHWRRQFGDFMQAFKAFPKPALAEARPVPQKASLSALNYLGRGGWTN
jgi:hypothetical protein